MVVSFLVSSLFLILVPLIHPCSYLIPLLVSHYVSSFTIIVRNDFSLVLSMRFLLALLFFSPVSLEISFSDIDRIQQLLSSQTTGMDVFLLNFGFLLNCNYYYLNILPCQSYVNASVFCKVVVVIHNT